MILLYQATCPDPGLSPAPVDGNTRRNCASELLPPPTGLPRVPGSCPHAWPLCIPPSSSASPGPCSQLPLSPVLAERAFPGGRSPSGIAIPAFSVPIICSANPAHWTPLLGDHDDLAHALQLWPVPLLSPFHPASPRSGNTVPSTCGPFSLGLR